MRDGMKHIAAVVCASILMFPLFSAQAQEKTRIAWAALNPAASPMWVVQDKRLLRKHGVDAEIIGINSSPIAMQALLAGDVGRHRHVGHDSGGHPTGRRRHDHDSNLGADLCRSCREPVVDH